MCAGTQKEIKHSFYAPASHTFAQATTSTTEGPVPSASSSRRLRWRETKLHTSKFSSEPSSCEKVLLQKLSRRKAPTYLPTPYYRSTEGWKQPLQSPTCSLDNKPTNQQHQSKQFFPPFFGPPNRSDSNNIQYDMALIVNM
jgi:hypothetical protein